MLESFLVLAVAIGLGLTVVGVLEERQRVAQLKEPLRRRPQLLVFDFPNADTNMVAQTATLDTLKRDWRNAIEIIPIRVFDQLEYTAQYGVYTVPTTILIDSRGRVAFVNESEASAATLWRQFAKVATPPANVFPPLEPAEPGPRTQGRLFQEMHEEMPCQS